MSQLPDGRQPAFCFAGTVAQETGNKVELRSADPWARNVLGVLQRPYSVGVACACDLRHGTTESTAVRIPFQSRVIVLSSFMAPNANWRHPWTFPRPRLGSESSLQEWVSQSMLFPERCDRSREGADEASVKALVGGPIESRNEQRLECRGCPLGRRQHLRRRKGRVREDSVVPLPAWLALRSGALAH